MADQEKQTTDQVIDADQLAQERFDLITDTIGIVRSAMYVIKRQEYVDTVKGLRKLRRDLCKPSIMGQATNREELAGIEPAPNMTSNK